jgi:beta-glucosidase
MTAPGPVLTPWRGEVHSIIHGLMPGQEYGNAIADVLFGIVNPSGKLPFTMPNMDNEQGWSPSQFPGLNLTVDYHESLLVDYRFYNARRLKSAFPFGLGLSYTNFRFSNLKVVVVNDHDHDGEDDDNDNDNVNVHVNNSIKISDESKHNSIIMNNDNDDNNSSNNNNNNNTGKRSNQVVCTVSLDISFLGGQAGSEVVQLYLTSPASTNSPPKQLRKFARTAIIGGSILSDTVHMQLNRKDFSIWDSNNNSWQFVSGKYVIDVGSSVEDILLSTSITV